jgi:dTDP-4-dehydrorhamnose 3,5-epimerase
MKIIKTKIEGVFLINLEPRKDGRGYFTRVFANEELKKAGINYKIVHINRSRTEKKGTIRGFHIQKAPKQEDKVVQCLKGAIFDVAIDLRKGSKTYGKWVSAVLDDKNMSLLLIPKGCAHAFQTLEPDTVVEYFVSEYYSPNHEYGIRWNDPLFKVKWPIEKVTVSDKDGSWLYVKKI